MLPSEIPIFPLPNVVLFPSALLPLHIFEPRYRAMVADALESERLIGHGDAAAGLGVALRRSARRLSDRMRRLHHARRSAARRPLQHHAARAGEIPDPRRAARARRRRALSHRAHRIDQGSEVGRDGGQSAPRGTGSRSCSRESCRRHDHDFIPKDVPDADLVHAIAQHLEPLEKQALLECNSLLERCEALVELLEMRMMPQGKSRMH